MLPYCSDDDLIRELSVVVTTGWFLPSRPERADDVRHLLLLPDPGESRSFAQAAQRFLTMLDTALKNADGTVLDEHAALGLRILFGVHVNYRTEASPIVRRAEASEYLVPPWRTEPARNRAEAFQKRRQRSALALALQCLRAEFGQQGRQQRNETDLLQEHRRYFVDGNRQITRLSGDMLLRARVDGVQDYVFNEARNSEPGVRDAVFRLLPHRAGSQATLESVVDDDIRPDSREIMVRLPRRHNAGEVFGVAWEEIVEFGPEVERYGRRFVSALAGNEGFDLEIRVDFADDAELPELAWWYVARPQVDVLEVGPQEYQVLRFGSGRSLVHHWDAIEVEKWLDHGIQWVWGPREAHWPPFSSLLGS